MIPRMHNPPRIVSRKREKAIANVIFIVYFELTVLHQNLESLCNTIVYSCIFGVGAFTAYSVPVSPTLHTSRCLTLTNANWCKWIRSVGTSNARDGFISGILVDSLRNIHKGFTKLKTAFFLFDLLILILIQKMISI